MPAPVSPCFRPLPRERALPSGVFGPVDFCPLRWHARRFFSLHITSETFFAHQPCGEPCSPSRYAAAGCGRPTVASRIISARPPFEKGDINIFSELGSFFFRLARE